MAQYKTFIVEKDETLTTNLFYIKKVDGSKFKTSNGMETIIDCIEADNENEVFDYLERKYFKENT